MGLLLTASNFDWMDLPYFDLKNVEWQVCLRLAKAAGTISQALVNHFELNRQYSVTQAQANKLAEGIDQALDYYHNEMRLPDGTTLEHLNKFIDRSRHFAKWAKKTRGFKLYNPDRPSS